MSSMECQMIVYPVQCPMARAKSHSFVHAKNIQNVWLRPISSSWTQHMSYLVEPLDHCFGQWSSPMHGISKTNGETFLQKCFWVTFGHSQCHNTSIAENVQNTLKTKVDFFFLDIARFLPMRDNGKRFDGIENWCNQLLPHRYYVFFWRSIAFQINSLVVFVAIV